MTKVSKVYLGLSRVSSAVGREAGSTGSGIGTGAATRSGIRTACVDMSTSRLIAVSPSTGGGSSTGSSSRGFTVTAIRISRPKATVSASSSCPRSRPSSWLRVKSLGTAMIAVLSCRVPGSLARSQARWLGCRSATTPRHAVLRSEVLGSTVPAHPCPASSAAMLGYPHPGPQGDRAPEPARPVVVVCPQLCPQVVNPSRLLWKQPARDAPEPCSDRVLAGQSPVAGEVAWVTDLVVRGILGVPGNLGSEERNKRRTPAARRHPQAGRAASGAGLTLWIASAY